MEYTLLWLGISSEIMKNIVSKRKTKVSEIDNQVNFKTVFKEVLFFAYLAKNI